MRSAPGQHATGSIRPPFESYPRLGGGSGPAATPPFESELTPLPARLVTGTAGEYAVATHTYMREMDQAWTILRAAADHAWQQYLAAMHGANRDYSKAVSDAQGKHDAAIRRLNQPL